MKKVILLLVLFFNIVPCVKNGEVTFGTSQLYAQQGGCRWHKPILGNSGGNSGGTTIGNIIRSIVTFFQISGGGNEAFGSENPDFSLPEIPDDVSDIPDFSGIDDSGDDIYISQSQLEEIFGTNVIQSNPCAVFLSGMSQEDAIYFIKEYLRFSGNPYSYYTLDNATKQKWEALSLYGPSNLSSLAAIISVLPQDIANVQQMSNVNNQVVNLDYFPVKITTLPTLNGHQVSANELLEYIRLHLNDFIDNTTMSITPYDASNLALWNDAATKGNGAVLKTSVNRVTSNNEGILIASNTATEPNNFKLTTIKDPLYAGTAPRNYTSNREFGYTTNTDGSYTFYSKGIDRAIGDESKILENAANAIKPEYDNDVWQAFNQKLDDFANTNLGISSVDNNEMLRPDFDKIKNVIAGYEALCNLSSNLNFTSQPGRPNTNNSDCKIIAETGDGTRSGDDWIQNSNVRPFDALDLLTNDQLLDKMKNTLQNFSTGILKTSAAKIWQHFKDKKTYDFEDRDLESQVILSQYLNTDWLYNVNKDFIKPRLQSVNGDIKQLSKINISALGGPNFPIYEYSIAPLWSSGLFTIIGGTQYASVCLKEYNFDHITRKYKAVCRITVLDDFAVSSDDVDKGYAKQAAMEALIHALVPGVPVPDLVDGIKAFWILQHRRNYPPFVNRIEFKATFIGTL